LMMRISRTGLPSFTRPPSVASSTAPAGVAFVGRLPGDPERLGDLRPRPPTLDRPLNRGSLEPVGKPTERHHGRERGGRIVG